MVLFSCPKSCPWGLRTVHESYCSAEHLRKAITDKQQSDRAVFNFMKGGNGHVKRLEKNEKKKLCTTKKIIWLCLINGIIWVWCSYALAFIGMLKEDYTGASIAESLSSAAVTEIIGVVLVYCLKSLIEKRKDFGEVGKDDMK